MKKLLCLPLLCGLAFGANFKISTKYTVNQISGLKQGNFTITALDDNLTISNIVVNRGNCKNSFKQFALIRSELLGQYSDKPSVKLNYGKSIDLVAEGGCRILEIQITSNKGKETYKF